MQDEQIVELYLKRDESAIGETKSKYGRYLSKIAYNILGDVGDCEETLSDVYLGAWSSIPPQKPKVLQTYLAKLTRRASIDILRKRSRDKRVVSEYSVSLTELEDCLTDRSTPESEADLKLLAETVNSWLKTLTTEQRNAFICRYYYSDSIRDISKYLGTSEPKAKSMLYRLRIGLKAYLEKEEIIQ